MPIKSTFSIKDALSIGIDSPIVGLAADDSTKKIFSTENPNGGVSPVYIRSKTCWAKNIDLSPASPWNSAFGTYFGGTLISPRHIVGASHAFPSNGSTLIFVDMENNCYTRTITTSQRVTTTDTTDIQIGLLDSDLPSNISFCKVATFSLANIENSYASIPAIWLDQESKALIGEYWYYGYLPFTVSGIVFPQWMGGVRVSNNPQRALFWEGVLDSGKPVSFVYNNQMILLFTFSVSDLSTFAAGGSISYYLNAVNSVMTSLGGGYTLSLFDENTLKQSKGLITFKQGGSNGKISTIPSCSNKNINKLSQIEGSDAPIGNTFNNIAFDYNTFANNCALLGFDPNVISNSLGGINFSSNFVVIRANNSYTINSDVISDIGNNTISISNFGGPTVIPNNYYRFFVMCKNGWRIVNFNGTNYSI